jgi:hypothetical protein
LGQTENHHQKGGREMKYTVEIIDDTMTTIKSRHDCSKKEAVSLARSWIKQIDADGKDYQVYVTWFRSTDQQHGYLNADGNHAITGRAW